MSHPPKLGQYLTEKFDIDKFILREKERERFEYKLKNLFPCSLNVKLYMICIFRQILLSFPRKGNHEK